MAASRTHPPTLLRILDRALRAPPHRRLLVAVSGGGDSMALLHALTLTGLKRGVTCVAHAIDHGLRPAAKSELALAAVAARAWGVPFRVTRVALTSGANLQARARHARYDALKAAALADGMDAVVTAHHIQDRAETVLMALLRGASARAIASLRIQGEWDGFPLWRPLLATPKSAIERHLERHQIPYATDPSNKEPRFLRARVREEVLPRLRELDPNLDDHLSSLADELAFLLCGAGPP